MKKILLGMACIALITSCSKVNISEEDNQKWRGKTMLCTLLPT